jgi:hypothetical protein
MDDIFDFGRQMRDGGCECFGWRNGFIMFVARDNSCPKHVHREDDFVASATECKVHQTLSQTDVVGCFAITEYFTTSVNVPSIVDKFTFVS